MIGDLYDQPEKPKVTCEYKVAGAMHSFVATLHDFDKNATYAVLENDGNFTPLTGILNHLYLNYDLGQFLFFKNSPHPGANYKIQKDGVTIWEFDIKADGWK
jgi:hypothetical protein